MSHLNRYIAILMLLMLCACGDSCYDDIVVTSGTTYVTKTKTITGIKASSSDWTPTGIVLPQNLLDKDGKHVIDNTVTLEVSKNVSVCGTQVNNSGDGVHSYITACIDSKKYFCKNKINYDAVYTSAPQVSDLSGCSLLQSTDLSGSATCDNKDFITVCDNGAQKALMQCKPTDSTCLQDCKNKSASCPTTWKWMTVGQCSEIASCGSNGNQFIRAPSNVEIKDKDADKSKDTGKEKEKAKEKKFMNLSFDTGIKCGDNTKYSTNGKPYPILAANAEWTRIDGGDGPISISDGDDIELTIQAPTEGDPAMGPDMKKDKDASVNRATFAPYTLPAGADKSKCPAKISFDPKNQKLSPCDSPSKCQSTDCAPVCTNDTAPLDHDLGSMQARNWNCWFVGGASMRLWFSTAPCGITTNLGVYNPKPNPQYVTKLDADNSNPNIIWFNDKSQTSLLDVGGILTSAYEAPKPDGTTKDGVDLSNVLRQTKRKIIVKGDTTNYICARFADTDGNYDNNAGGYTIFAKRAKCVGRNGYPAPVFTEGNSPQYLGALEYAFMKPGDTNVTARDARVVATEKYYGLAPDNSANKNLTVVETSKQFGINGGEHALTKDGSRTLLLRVRDNPGEYGDNSGVYDVKITYKHYTTTGPISKMIEEIRDSMRDIILGKIDESGKPKDGILPDYFKQFTCPKGVGNCTASPYLDYIRVLLVLYITLYGLTFIMGYTKIHQKDLIIRVIKIGVVLALISDNSWDFFHKHFFDLFIYGTDTIIQKALFADSEAIGASPFYFIDNILALLLLNPSTWLKILGLFVTPMGIILVPLLLFGVFYFLIGITSAIVTYLMSILSICLLLLLAPIFIPFILFENTRKMFDNWIKMMVRYSLEPVMLIIGLAILVELLYALFRQVLDFRVCWKCMWPINLSFPGVTDVLKAFSINETIFCFQFFGPAGVLPGGAGGMFSAMSVDIVDIVLIIIITFLIKDYGSMIDGMMTQMIGEKADIFKITGGESRRFESAGEHAVHSIGLRGLQDTFESKVSKTARAGFMAGINKVMDIGKKVDSKTTPSQQTSNYNSLGMPNQPKAGSSGVPGQAGIPKLTPAMVDSHVGAFNNVMGSLSNERSAQRLGDKDLYLPKDARARAAEMLGNKMFESLRKNPDAYHGFVSGMSSLSSMDADKLNKVGGVGELHSVLQDTRTSLEIMSNQNSNDADRKAAETVVARAMFTNKELTEAMLDDSKRTDLLKEVYSMGNQLDSKGGQEQ